MATHFAEFSGSSGMLATCPGRIASGHYDGTISVRDLLFGAELFQLRLGLRLRALAFSPSGDRLFTITCDNDGRDIFIRVFDGKTGRDINGRQLPGRSYQYGKIAFAPDGSQIFVAAHDRQLGAFDGECRRELWSAPVPGSYATMLAVSPDGSEVVTACRNDGNTMTTAWSASSGAELRRVPLKQRLADTSCAFAPDARSFVVLLFGTGTVAAIDAGSGDELWRREVSGSTFSAVSYSPDSRFIFIGARSGDAAVVVHDAADGRIVARVPVRRAPAPVPGVRVHVDGVASALAGRVIAVTLFDGSNLLKLFSKIALSS